jgi:2,3-bisphosphoglycerate-independent phosphoglycerate mutase
MALFFLFVDGVGVGEKNVLNPLVSERWDAFSWFTDCEGLHSGCGEVIEENRLFKKLDANLGVEGLPQSGTGQVALFSGENASKMIGKHFGPFPYSITKPILQKRSLFHKVLAMGMKPHFLNAYPDIFFKRSEKRDRWTSTTLMTKSAGVKLNGLQDILEEKAVTAEIIQSAWRDMLGLDVPEITPEDAGARVINGLRKYDLVLYEYYLTDKSGHEMDKEKAERVLTILNRFMIHILKNMDPGDTFVMTSDHGNMENLDMKTHTRNPVPLFVKGNTAPFKNAESILDVTPGILKVLESESGRIVSP